MTQKLPRYEMHKYWGKKPPQQLKELLETYSKEGDVVFDPFSGYGVFIGEAYINKRNVISNDLNPVASFIQKQLLISDFDILELEKIANQVLNDITKIDTYWHEIKCPNCNEKALISATLRTKENIPIKCKIQCECTRRAIEHSFSDSEIDTIIKKEKENSQLPKHPSSKIFHNSRISAYKGLTTDELFSIRSMSCHIELFKTINKIDDDVYKELLLLAFTSNLANCSRLVPPIKSRGDMAPGAWMTGFYVGQTYIENNVFHYFKNRVSKLLSGKKDFLAALENNKIKPANTQVYNISDMNKDSLNYILDNHDTKKLPYPDNSIDYIFTDPPYGDSVPYFEQSVLWNTWLGFSVDYDNEVVISDSKERKKKAKNFSDEIEQCINEISRVLKPKKYFSLTFHSISGEEWYGILKGCLKNNFILHDFEWLTQKTFSPRQLNRAKTVKGDVLITLQKSANKTKHKVLSNKETEDIIIDLTRKLINNKEMINTNDIYMSLLHEFFSKHYIIANVNIIKILSKNFQINDSGIWSN